MEDEDCDNDEICIDNNCVYIEPEKECDNGETKCEGKVYYLCENDKWESQGQVDGKCGYESNPGECTTGMTKCESTVYYICENEKWISKGQVDGKCGYLEQLEPYCGDENLDTNLGEQCDGYDWGSVASCRDFDFNLGTLDCIECIFDTSACYNRTRSDECWYNSDCSDGYKCENLKCVIDTVKRCSSPSDCDINELCIKRVCVNGQECVYKRDCIAGKICAEGRCVYPDYECIQDIDCEDNEECDRGYCVEKENIECRYNRDCDKGEECDDGKCIEAPDCIKDEDCGSGYKCEDDHCEKEVGEECSLTKLCSENHYCEDGYCIKEDELEVECETFRDCDFGFTCLKNECVNRTTSKTCDGLGGDLCASTQECKGSYEEIRGVICCLDVLCTEKEQSSTGKFIGWGLIIIVGLALVFFFFKYKGTKRRVTSFRKIGLRR